MIDIITPITTAFVSAGNNSDMTFGFDISIIKINAKTVASVPNKASTIP